MPDPIKITSIEVRRMPGFRPPGFEVDELGDGITVLHGPNASGKSTLARAISAVLWPDHAPTDAEIRAQAELGAAGYTFDLQGRAVTCQRDGAPADRPPLPPPQTRDRAVLTLPELLRRTESDEALAKAILEESAGGFNARASAEALGFKNVAPRTGDATRNFDAAREALATKQKRAADTRTEEEQLDALRRRRETAADARKRLELLERAKKHAEKRGDERTAQHDVDGFPTEMAEFDGREGERLDDIDLHLTQARKTKADAVKEITDAEAVLDDVALPEDGVPATTLRTLEKFLETLEAREDDISGYNQKKPEMTERRAAPEQRLGGHVDRDKLAEVDVGSIKDFEDQVRNREKLASRRNALEAEHAALGEPEETAEPESISKGITHLSTWLRSHGTGVTAPRSIVVTAWLAALTILALSIILGLTVHPAGFSGILLALVVLGMTHKSSRADGQTDLTGAHRQEYNRTGLAPPEAWTPDAVADQLDELTEGLVAARTEASRTERRKELQRQLKELATKEQQHQTESKGLAERLGIPDDASAGELLWTATTIMQWQKAQSDLDAIKKALDEATTQRDEALDNLNESLNEYGYEPAEDVEAVAANVEDLRARELRREAAQATIDRAAPQRDGAKALQTEYEDKRRALFEDVGLEPGSDERLRALVDQSEDYDKAVTKVAKLREQSHDLEQELREHPLFEARVLEATLEELDTAADAARSKADEWEELNGRILAIETRVEDRKGETAIEQALADADRAQGALESELFGHQAASVGDLLANDVHEQTRDRERPAVFHDAKDLFLEISRYRYRLEFDDAQDPASFVAFDIEDGIGKGFHELSDGTKVQLLLSVRLAFLRRQEHGAAVPLILDETLANADDDRAVAIIQAAAEIARGGRQVLYLTAQRDEVAKWEAAMANNEDVPFKVIDFGKAAGARRDEKPLDIPFAGVPEGVLDPGDMDHGAYGEALAVPPIGPLDHWGKAHVWFVVEDPPLLHEVLQRGVRAAGPLKTLLDSGARTAIIPSDALADRVRALLDALKAIVEATRIGRGKPVDRAALEASGAVSETHIDNVAALAEEVGGDAEQLIGALDDDARKPKRWWQSKTDELRSFLEANGYADPMDPLDAEQLQARVLADVPEWIDNGTLTMVDVQRLIGRAATTP